ncbi:MAG: hypothetical protein QF921_13850 [Pseudomonadales bacterium]|jgi:ADP-ribose pyrophosphatase YjhB (NUDIX family)|nr:hypothetical protein [Pseudomonadales bacterium]MDP6472280.1 hypothetical protein [Pseudomonadales bacterium]MDP6828075.1 hypothetical protein [Pseudomonadales bacterium]MDP6972563.1 hypothetical protein [Pseudomonadales bacterium]|tara:strand:- start:948 stop:1346 length:399 start_codon:yes stop_codon:yes gene_type:complete
MLRRFNTEYEDGNYSLVAGHVDGDEAIRQVMSLEALEAAGLDVAPGDMQLFHIMHRKCEQERLSFFFITERWRGDAWNSEPDKCDHMGWFRTERLPKNTIAYVREALCRGFAGERYSEFGWDEENEAGEAVP